MRCLISHGVGKVNRLDEWRNPFEIKVYSQRRKTTIEDHLREVDKITWHAIGEVEVNYLPNP